MTKKKILTSNSAERKWVNLMNMLINQRWEDMTEGDAGVSYTA